MRPLFRVFAFLFSIPFLLIGVLILGHTPAGSRAVLPWLLLFSYLGIYIALSIWMAVSPWGKAKRLHQLEKREKAKRLRKAFNRARKRGDTRITFEGQSYTVPTRTYSSSSGSSYSSSSFSGGGGSSGGGGASGGW